MTMIPTCYAMLNTAYAHTRLPDKRGEEDWHGFSRVYIYGHESRVNVCAIDGSVAVKMSYTYDGYQDFEPFTLLLNKQHLSMIKDQFVSIDTTMKSDRKGNMVVDIEGDGRHDCLVTVHVPAGDDFGSKFEWFNRTFFPDYIEDICASSTGLNIHTEVMNKLSLNQYGWKNVIMPDKNLFDMLRIRPVRRNDGDPLDGSGIFYVSYPVFDVVGVYHDLKVEQVFMGWALQTMTVKE